MKLLFARKIFPKGKGGSLSGAETPARSVVKEVGTGFLVLLITVLAFKFIAWNYWKLEQAVTLTKEIFAAPPAVNLTVSTENSLLFQKSFSHNRNGHYYIINHFDITPHIKDIAGGSITLTVNDQKIDSFLLFRFTRFNIVHFNDYYFALTTQNCRIEDLVRLRETMPVIAGSLFKLALKGKQNTKECVHRLFDGTPEELRYRRGRFTAPLVSFEEGKIYEVIFHYKAVGDTVPVIMLAGGPNGGEFTPLRYQLDTSIRGRYRKAALLFRSPARLVSPVLHLSARGRRGHHGPFSGKVFFRDISVYRNAEKFPGSAHLNRPSIVYFNFLNKIKDEFIGKEFISQMRDFKAR
ncbi:MAG: hypothetical protein GY950_37010 [bacterium]|nr:hypothetical protein [bacterium]